MNRFLRLLMLGGVGAVLASWQCVADTNVNTTVSPTANDQVGRVVVQEEPALSVDSVNTATRLQRPPRLERNALPPDVLRRIEQFKIYAQRYLDQQEALRRQMVGATDQDRAKIREQLRGLRDQWLERSRELRQEFKERQRELLEKLPAHREVLEGAREAAREQLRDKAGEIRNRRGEE